MTRGIDDRVMTDSLGDVDRRAYGNPDGDASNSRWPPPSKGPLPPADALPSDLHIFSAHDEADAWAHEHDAATELLASLKDELVDVEVDFISQKAAGRRAARENPRERGRRTSADIDSEVDEHLIEQGVLRRKLDLEAQIDAATGRLFRARDNIQRLEWYVKSLPRTDGRP